jgi:ADP-ribosylglycohydrolase
MNQRGYFNNGPGQVTDDSELAMCQLNGLLRMEKGKFDPNKIAFFYKEWIKSQPFDIGITTRKAFSKLLKVDDHEWLAATVQDFVEASKFGSLSNGSLMRATPLAVYCRNLNDFQMREVVRQDVSMTHSDIIIKDAVLLYVVCISKIINDPDNLDIALEYVRDYANLHVFSQAREWLEISVQDLEKVGAEKNIGFARIGFHHAFREFKKVLDGPRFNGDTFPHAVSNILTLGGDTDTNAAIVGGLIGACVGYNNLPVDWKIKVEGIYDQVSWIQRPDFLDQRKVKENVIQLFNKTD